MEIRITNPRIGMRAGERRIDRENREEIFLLHLAISEMPFVLKAVICRDYCDDPNGIATFCKIIKKW
jgi:hypothetical protein